MSYEIEVQNRQKSVMVEAPEISRWAREALTFLKIRRAALSIILLTNRSIRVVNKEFLSHDYPTDVITFDLSDGELSRSRKPVREMDGEIYISAVMARENAVRFKTTPRQEIALYLVHGILHLCGYDDHSQDDQDRMRNTEQDVMGHLKM